MPPIPPKIKLTKATNGIIPVIGNSFLLPLILYPKNTPKSVIFPVM